MQALEIQPGVYDSPQVVSHRLEVLPTGTQMMRVIFRILYSDNQHYSDVEWSAWFGDKSVDRSLDALEWMGWSGADIMELASGSIHEDTCLLRGDQVSIDVRVESYKDKLQTRVAFVNRLGASAFDPTGINVRVAARRRSQGAPMPQPVARPQAPVASAPAATSPAAKPAAPRPAAPLPPPTAGANEMPF